ncbi:MAG: alcohol dehydrogenase catalytic domain-containing protein [Anaerolineae bacterium]
MMRALIFDNDLRLETGIAIPQVQEDQALLKIRKAGICNTDLELMKGYRNFRGILGHEFVAEVAQGPDELIGKRVVGEINVACGKCDLCLRGIPTQCRNRSAVGIFGHPGAFADYLALVTRNLHLVDDDITDDQAVFVEPLASALNILELVHVSPSDHVVVIGLGKLGMLAAQVLKLTGAHVTGITRRDKQAALLAKWGIAARHADELPRHHAAMVVDCTGVADGFATALQLVQPRGTIVLKSTYVGIPAADLTNIAVNEIRVVGSRCGPFEAALRLLKLGLVDVTSLIDARFPLDEAKTAIAYAEQKGALKVLLDI